MSYTESLPEPRPTHPSKSAYKQLFLGLTGKAICFASRRSSAERSQNCLVTDLLQNTKSS